MRSRLFQVASALLPPLGKIRIDAFVEIPKAPARRHRTIVINSDHFFGDDQRMLVSSLGQEHVTGTKLIGNTFAGGNSSPLNDYPIFVVIVKMELDGVTCLQAVDSVFCGLGPSPSSEKALKIC
jgi:hypothetical protein